MGESKRLRIGQYLVFPKNADPETDKTCLYKVVGFDKLGRPRMLKRYSVSTGTCERIRSVPRHHWTYYRVISREGIPIGELTDCMKALEDYWKRYPEDRARLTKSGALPSSPSEAQK